MTSRKNHWMTRGAAWSVAGVCALSLNGCIFFGTEFCDSTTDTDCQNPSVGGFAAASGDGDVGSGASGLTTTGGRPGDGGSPNTGGVDGTGASDSGGSGAGGTSTGGSSTGGVEAGSGGDASGGAGGTGGMNTGGAGTGGDEGTGGTSGIGRITISEVRTGNGSTWVELHNGSGGAVSTLNLAISSAASSAPNYSDACSLAALGAMDAGAVAVVTQYDGPCPGAAPLCRTSCYNLVATAGRYIQLFEGSEETSWTLLKQAYLPTPDPNGGDTYHLDDEIAGTFTRAEPTPGTVP